MQTKHAAIAGASIGLLAGSAICLIIGTTLSDALFRISILVVGGAWMGTILALLNALLMPKDEGHISGRPLGRRS